MNLMSVLSHMDRNGDYHTSDTLLKIAIDLEIQNQIGRGGFGIYHSNYNKQQLQHIKNRMGLPMQSNMGIKEFHNYSSLTTIIKEIVPAILFPKIINKYTDLNAVEISIPSFTWALRNRSMISPRASGVDWQAVGSEQFLSQHPARTDFEFRIFEAIQPYFHSEIDGFILIELSKIGILWTDRHGGNYMVDAGYSNLISQKITELVGISMENTTINPQDYEGEYYQPGRKMSWEVARELSSKIDPLASEWMDLHSPSGHITIIDFGFMKAEPESPAGKEVYDFLSKLEPYINKNSLIANIHRAGNYLLE